MFRQIACKPSGQGGSPVNRQVSTGSQVNRQVRPGHTAGYIPDRKQDHFNANVMKQLKYNADMIARLSDLLFRISNDVRGVGKHASIFQT